MTELIKAPPSWLKQGISSLTTGIVLIGGMLATGIVDLKKVDIQERDTLTRNYLQMADRMDQQEEMIRTLRMEYWDSQMQLWRSGARVDSLMQVVIARDKRIDGLQLEVNYLKRKVEELESVEPALRRMEPRR